MTNATQPKIQICQRGLTEYVECCLRELHAHLDCQELDPAANLEDQLRGVEMVIDIGGHASREIIDAAVDTKFWQVIGTGLDNCEVQYTLDKEIQLGNTPGFTSALGLSECAMMYILMLTRKYHEARDNFQSGTFFTPNGKTLDQMALGIIGFGASGRQLAKRAKSFGMRVEAIDIRPLDTDLPDDMQPDYYGLSDEMDSVISRCDVVSLHLHLTPETTHIIDGRRLGLMKPSAFLINVARGALIDEDALADAILSGKIAGAGIDVFANEPADISRPEYQLPNFIATPHTSGQTDETIRQRCAIAVDNARRLATGEKLLHLIDASMGLGK
jgi:phosphoglycerate dehydrogenase-like enzyme